MNEREQLQADLNHLWLRYLIYANNTIEVCNVPAPFGATDEEKAIIQRVKDWNAKPQAERIRIQRVPSQTHVSPTTDLQRTSPVPVQH